MEVECSIVNRAQRRKVVIFWIQAPTSHFRNGPWMELVTKYGTRLLSWLTILLVCPLQMDMAPEIDNLGQPPAHRWRGLPAGCLNSA